MTATTVFLLQICFLSTCSNILLHDPQLNRQLTALVVATRRSTPAPATTSSPRQRPRRSPHTAPCHHSSASSSTSNSSTSSTSRRRRASSPACAAAFLQQVSHSFASSKILSSSRQPGRRRKLVHRAVVLEHILALHDAMEDPLPLAHDAIGRYEAAMPPPPAPASSAAGAEEQSQARSSFESRSSRSASTASRSTNRLSLTLPIAPPSSLPSRPTAVATAAPSCPPTPSDAGLVSPTDPTDFIIAIAAQERRVLELREELSRAEHELRRLKKQWSHHEAHKKRVDVRRAESVSRPAAAPQATTPGPAALDEGDPTRPGGDMDRRKALLLAQAIGQATPGSGRRRVIRGGHTRALSLLSPVKTNDAFSVHEDSSAAPTPSPSSSLGRSPMLKDSEPHLQNLARAHTPVTPAQLSKRASWAPRSVHQGPTHGVKQIAEDFKAGLWTFVEDLRQATVGDEPIHGGGLPLRASDGGHVLSPSPSGPPRLQEAGDQATIRASATAGARPHVADVFGDTPTPAARHADAQQREDEGAAHKRATSKTETAATKPTKRFSWTPLAMDSIDDNDWSNWDSPATSTKSPRWSGTTVNGDIIPAVPEKGDENSSTPSKRSTASAATTAPTSPSSLKLEELSLGMLNRLTPGNLKRTASDFMKEWEKSLSPPPGSGPRPAFVAGKEKDM